MKKKPQVRKSAIKTVFSDFRSRLYTSKVNVQTYNHEIIAGKEGYTLILHREKDVNQKLYFSDKQLLDSYLRTI